MLFFELLTVYFDFISLRINKIIRQFKFRNLRRKISSLKIFLIYRILLCPSSLQNQNIIFLTPYFEHFKSHIRFAVLYYDFRDF